MTSIRTRFLGALATSSLVVATAASTTLARDLAFTERVAAQTAIEQVYWSQRIWPEGNSRPKPPLESVLTEHAVAAKVARTLRLAAALDTARGRPVSGDELQEEIARMVADTQAPGTLLKLFSALDDDPFLIAECLARPALVARLAAAEDLDDDRSKRDAADVDLAPAIPPATGYSVPAVRGGGCVGGSWAVSSLTNGTGDRVPTPRRNHTAVWTGAEMIVWGGRDGIHVVNDGGVYDPATDTWLVSSLADASGTNVPSAREGHTAIWTGTEMIVWGGGGGGLFNTGGRYNPATDAWASSSLNTASGTNVPSARIAHTALWTGSAMIVWGGTTYDVSNTGGIFDAASDAWLSSSLTDASGANVPVARAEHTAVWTGTEMIVWGGRDDSYDGMNTGGSYNPATDSWAVTILNNGSGAHVPSTRFSHTAVWTGSEMIIWGGLETEAYGGIKNTGGRYSRATDTWLPTSLTNGTGPRVPTRRYDHTAIWTGDEMIVWGGFSDPDFVLENTGGRFSPATDGWAVSSLTAATGTGVPTARRFHTAVWTAGSDPRMIVWGGDLEIDIATGPFTNTGGLFCTACEFTTWYADADGDDYGDPAVTSVSCGPLPGYVNSAEDCNDENPAVHPAGLEICDGLDNDCDTVTDAGNWICDEGNICTANVCNGTGGCGSASANLDVTGFSAARVDGLDLVVLADAWNSCPGDTRYDAAANLDQATTLPDSCVDAADFHSFMNAFGQSCP